MKCGGEIDLDQTFYPGTTRAKPQDTSTYKIKQGSLYNGHQNLFINSTIKL